MDSTVECSFAEQLERMDEINFYLKLPSWFTIRTPSVNYNPDWAIIKEEDGQSKLYFVAETKGSTDAEDRRGKENQKIQCGIAHFETLSDVFYKVVTNANDLYL